MTALLHDANNLFAQLQRRQPLKREDQERLNKKFRLEFSYNSNHLEGNTLTYGETKLLLFFDQTSGNHTKQELDEMQAHDVAWQIVQNWAADAEHILSEKDIKELNEIILVRPFWKDAVTPDGQSTRRRITIGDYKLQPNSVILANGEMFHYASPAETPIAMGELIDWFRSAEAAALHPIAQAALLHYKFVCIHPFDDGNGRISRLLMNYVLCRAGYPPVIIKSETKKDYLRALNRADAGDLNAFVEYIAECEIWSLQTSLKAANGKSIDEPGDFDKRIELLKRKTGKFDEVKMKYGKEALEITLEHLVPLFEALEVAMQKLDVFISRRRMIFSTGEIADLLTTLNSVEALNIYRTNGELLSLSKQIAFPPTRLTLKMEIGTENGLLFEDIFDVYFRDNNYDLFLGFWSKYKSYLYGNEMLISKEDIDEIVELLGNSIVTKIEEQLTSE